MRNPSQPITTKLFICTFNKNKPVGRKRPKVSAKVFHSDWKSLRFEKNIYDLFVWRSALHFPRKEIFATTFCAIDQFRFKIWREKYSSFSVGNCSKWKASLKPSNSNPFLSFIDSERTTFLPIFLGLHSQMGLGCVKSIFTCMSIIWCPHDHWKDVFSTKLKCFLLPLKNCLSET